MEDHHKRAIQKNFPELINNCNTDVLLPHLVQKNVFSNEMIHKYLDQRDPSTRKRDLFMDIQRRGPDAFRHLIESLLLTGHKTLAFALDPDTQVNHQTVDNHTNRNVGKHAVPFQLPTNEESRTHDPGQIQIIGACHSGAVINLSTEPLRIDVKPAVQFYGGDIDNGVPVYSTCSKNRGAVLIINNIEYEDNREPYRTGADVDSKSLNELFKQMGMTHIECHYNLKSSEIKEQIMAFCNSPVLTDVDMSVVIIMAHGNGGENITNIVGSDVINVPTDWIENQFSNALCPAMHNKPKIIMYQVCRGTNEDLGVSMRVQTDSSPQYVIREKSDLLIAHSTLPGFKSHRDVYVGTWYIQLFCEMCMKYAHNKHLADILTLVDARLAHLRSEYQTMQTSTYTNLGFRRCYFNPGIYLENNELKHFNSNM